MRLSWQNCANPAGAHGPAQGAPLAVAIESDMANAACMQGFRSTTYPYRFRCSMNQ